MTTHHGMVDPAIFENLQERVDEDQTFRESIKDIVQQLEKQTRSAQSALSRVHSSPINGELLENIDRARTPILQTVKRLEEVASKQPYYKWNQMWSRQIQDVVFCILLHAWLTQPGNLLTLDNVGVDVLKVPVNLKDRDAFHITIEEYLQAVISLLDELARLARNSVTLGNYRLPLLISEFIKEVHAGFQILNLKNDSLRRRSDGIKYRVKEVEDVVYDLSLRNLIPKDDSKGDA